MQNFDPTNLDHLIQSVHKANRPEVWKVRTLLQGAAAYTQQARSLIIGEVHPEVPRLGVWELPLYRTATEYCQKAAALIHEATELAAQEENA